MFNLKDTFVSLINLLSHGFLVVHAEEANNEGSSETPEVVAEEVVPVAPSGDAIAVAEFRNKVRSELSSQYNTKIKGLSEEKKTLTKHYNEALVELGELQQKYSDLKDKVSKNTQVSELTAKLEEASKTIDDLKANTPDESALRQAIEKEYEVKLYIRDSLSANKESILDVFAETVGGNTKEEVDASIELAKSKTSKAKEQLGFTEANKGTFSQATTKNTKNNVSIPNPSLSMGNGKISIEDYLKMDVSSPEFAEARKLMGLS